MGAALGAPSVPSLSSAKGPAGYSHPEVPRGRSREGVEGAWPFHALWWPRALPPYPSRLGAPGSEGRVSFGCTDLSWVLGSCDQAHGQDPAAGSRSGSLWGAPRLCPRCACHHPNRSTLSLAYSRSGSGLSALTGCSVT